MTLYERHDHATFEEPSLIVALEGWIDAGLGAAGAVTSLLGELPTEPVATFDAEQLIDQRARRPTAHIVDGVNRGMTWPVIEMRSGKDRNGADVCFLVGPEPDFRWRAFSAAVIALAEELGIRMAVGLGAFPAPAPHTRPVRLAATAPDLSAELVTRVGIVLGAIDVPSSVWGALELAFGEAGIPAVGLWARVPHYVAGMAYPAASAALLDGLNMTAGLSFDTARLRTAADASFRQIDDLIARSEEHTSLVRRLERTVDAAEGNALDVGQVPTGDELASELERYLREQRNDGGVDTEP
jgi:proteasome assembly chaperone (PAC2) family protein